MDLLCAMHENGRTGIITGTVLELAQMCRCSVEEMRKALRELKRSETASVTKCHKMSRDFQVINRRMQREYKTRLYNAERQRKHRMSHESQNSSSLLLDLVSKKLSKERESSSLPAPSLSEDFSDEYLDDLQDQKKFAHLDVRHVHEKFEDWCDEHRIKPKRARFIDWLNREIPGKGNGPDDDDRGSSDQAARVAARLSGDN